MGENPKMNISQHQISRSAVILDIYVLENGNCMVTLEEHNPGKFDFFELENLEIKTIVSAYLNYPAL